MAVILAEQEARRDHLSGATGGGAIDASSVYTSASDVDLIHHVTAGNADSVWVQAWNDSAASVDLNLVLNPSDDTSTVAIDLVTVTISIPAKDSLWVLQGDAFRLRGTNTSTLTAYVASADKGLIKLTGYVVRTRGALLY